MYIKAFIRYLLSLGLILPALAFISAPAVAAADCSGPNDVTVVIDYKELNKEAEVLCAEDKGGASAYEVLQAAGVQLQGTADFGDAAICRVNGAPDETLESCETFSTSAYWALVLGADGAWTMAQNGVQDQSVEGGTFLGLSYEPITDDVNAVAEPGFVPNDETRGLIAVPQSTDESTDPNYWMIGIGVLVVLVVIAGIVLLPRRKASGE